jgi:hypothetical protein
VERLLARLERRFGRFALPNLTNYVVGGMAFVIVTMMAQPMILFYLPLDPFAVMHGQVWRLVTFLFIPPPTSLIWMLFELYMIWLFGSNLENAWGAFRLNLYYAIGILGAFLGALVSGVPAWNIAFNASLFFAFATLFPDMELLLFFFIPVKVKWLGWLAFAGTLYAFFTGGWGERASIIAAYANYLLFFAPTIAAMLRGQRIQWQQEARRASFRPSNDAPAAAARACAVCGAKEADGADIRVCSCEKCKAATGGASRTLCLEHARNH